MLRVRIPVAAHRVLMSSFSGKRKFSHSAKTSCDRCRVGYAGWPRAATASAPCVYPRKNGRFAGIPKTTQHPHPIHKFRRGVRAGGKQWVCRRKERWHKIAGNGRPLDMPPPFRSTVGGSSRLAPPSCGCRYLTLDGVVTGWPLAPPTRQSLATRV